MSKNAAIIMAAGLGTRMISRKPKILHEVCGKPMLQWVIDSLQPLKLERIVVILGQKNGPEFGLIRGNVEYVIQKEKKGTAHAVMQAEKVFKNYKGNVLILSGDVPLIRTESLRELLSVHEEHSAAATIMTTVMENPSGYGRILRSGNQVVRIVEELDADHTRTIREINTGTYCFKNPVLQAALKQVKPNPLKNEYYLTDVIALLNTGGSRIVPLVLKDHDEVMGVNRRHELEKANKIMQKRIQRRLMDQGVTILDGDNTYVDATVKIGQDTVIYPFTLLYGSTVVGEECRIGPHATVTDTRIGKGSRVHHSYLTDSILGSSVTVGPYAHIREGTVIKDGARVGNFVEIARSSVGETSRAYHLSYLGDTTLGKNVNLGAGIITANFDAVMKKKNKTVIGDGVSIGSNTVIIAPARVPPKTVIPAHSIVRGNGKAKEKGTSREHS